MGARRSRSVAAWVGVPLARTAVVAVVVVVMVLVAALLVVRAQPGADGDPGPAADTASEPAAEASTTSATGSSATTVSAVSSTTSSATSVPRPAGRGWELREAACDERLEVASVSAPVRDPGLVEVSGVAVDDDGVTWVVNDSGDSARLFGLRLDGAGTGLEPDEPGEPTTDDPTTVQTVTVTGAENVDWEDLALDRSGDVPALWVADAGDNLAARASVTLYRVELPDPSATSVAAHAVTVTYPDGAHDVEAVVAEPDGDVVLFTKEPGRSRAYRVDVGKDDTAEDVDSETVLPGTVLPETVLAEELGSFPVGDGVTSVLTSADLAADGSTLVLRTYGSVHVVAVPADRPLVDALADPASWCRALSPMELQGEAVALLPDAGGYVTMGEGVAPYLTTVVAPQP